MTTIQKELIFLIKNNCFCWQELILVAKEAIELAIKNEISEQEKINLNISLKFINKIFDLFKKAGLYNKDNYKNIDHSISNNKSILKECDKELISSIENDKNWLIYWRCLICLIKRLSSIKNCSKSIKNLKYYKELEGIEALTYAEVKCEDNLFDALGKLLAIAQDFDIFISESNDIEGLTSFDEEILDIDFKSLEQRIENVEINIDLNLKNKFNQSYIIKFMCWIKSWIYKHNSNHLDQYLKLERIDKCDYKFKIYETHNSDFVDCHDVERHVDRQNYQTYLIQLGLDMSYYWGHIYKININTKYKGLNNNNKEQKNNELNND